MQNLRLRNMNIRRRFFVNTSSSASKVEVGDVAYYDGSKIKTISYSKWNIALGTPIGVVVIPEGFAPDGKLRIVSLKYVDAGGNTSITYKGMKWRTSTTEVNTNLTDFTKVPITNNTGSTSTSSGSSGYLPMDNIAGSISFVDPTTNYSSNTPWIPSPYFGTIPNPEYYKTLSGNNALSDFNGLSNTQTLVGLGTDYVAANAAWKYDDGVSNLQWYLPAIGELGYLGPRFNTINQQIKAIGGAALPSMRYLWSSTESAASRSYFFGCLTGQIAYTSKDNEFYVRPFASLDIQTISNNSALITFTINGIECQAEEGMTWVEFINSEYNDGSFTSSGNKVKYNGYDIYDQSNILAKYTIAVGTIPKNSSYIIYSDGGGAD